MPDERKNIGKETGFNQTVHYQHLDARQQGIVTISAFTATGDVNKLKIALNSALNAGFSVSEVKEILVQLYAYCGFPRSLNGLAILMAVLQDRKNKGIDDLPGLEASPINNNTDKYDQGVKMLELLTGKAQSGPLTGINAFAPAIDVFLKEHLFADIFNRDILSYSQRELATITVLATLPGLLPQLQAHIGMGINVGLTAAQIKEAFIILQNNIGKSQADAANAVLSKVMETK